MKTLYKRIEKIYLDGDYITECCNKDILSLTKQLLKSNLSDDTKVSLLYQFNNNLITIKKLTYKILANTEVE